MTRKSNKWLALCVTSVGTLATAYNAGSINIANPVLVAQFSITLSQVQWVTTIYLIVVCSLMLLFGRIGDRVQSHKVYICGLAIFTFGSLLCGISNSLPMLIGCRAVQAFGAAMTLSTSMGLVATIFPPEQRGMSMGMNILMVGLGNVSGPAIGGLILAVAPWSMIFFVTIPVALLALVLALFWLRSPIPPQKNSPPLDVVGSLLMVLIVASLILCISGGFEGSRWFGLLTVCALIFFLFFERRQPDPIIDFALMRKIRFSLGNLITFLSYAGNMMVGFQMPFFLEYIWSIPVGTAGLLLVIPALSMSIAGPVSGIISDRFGAMRVMPLSLVTVMISLVMIFFLGVQPTLPLFIAYEILNGLSMGLLNTPNNSEIMSAASREKSGYASGFVALNRTLAFCIGTAVSAGLFSGIEAMVLEQAGAVGAHMFALHVVLGLAVALTVVSLGVCLFVKSHQEKTSKSTLPEK